MRAGTASALYDQGQHALRAARRPGVHLLLHNLVMLRCCCSTEPANVCAQIDPRYFNPLANWNRGYSMETLLTDLRREMAAPQNRKLQQPQEGTTY